MPTYEYRCQHCHRSLESFQRMSDAPLVTCPYCQHDTLERVVSGGAGVIYKGEGWYVTDYSKKSSGGKDSGSSPASATAPVPGGAPTTGNSPATETSGKSATVETQKPESTSPAKSPVKSNGSPSKE